MKPGLSFSELQFIADKLAAGFDTLSQQIEEQRKTEHDLRLRLEHAIEKCEEIEASGSSSSAEISEWRDETYRPDPQITSVAPARPAESTDRSIHEARAALDRLKHLKMPAANGIRKCPIAHKSAVPEELERDFTVAGKPSDLACPFANGNGAVSNIEDPIAAEFHTEKSSTRSQDAASRCPIRFLDKHSPEEIAQYFENHKHEIPRSHQICVRRYQTNEQSIRHLDAKYGNMVSMIQGLGNKHKQYLPEGEKVAGETEQISSEAVEKWAENVPQEPLSTEDDKERVTRFEKPLRDIRVGESPSRPWGIPVPVDKSPAASVVSSGNAVVKSIKPPSSTPAPLTGKAGPTHEPDVTPAKDHNEVTSATQETQPARPQIVFNGPVFFGYSAEQAAVFLQHLNLSTTR